MITGTISPSDYLNAQRLHRAKSVRWCYLASVATIIIGVGTYCFSSRNVDLVIAYSGIAWLLVELITSRIYLPWKVRRLHAQQKDLSSPFTYSWDSGFLEAQGVSGQSKRAWKNYAKCKEDERIFLLYHADNLFEMFPKSWFQNQAQICEFRELANRAGRT